MIKKKIAIIGGDKRQGYLAENFSQKFFVDIFYLQGNFDEILENYDVYILPMPITKDGIHLNTNFSENQVKLIDIIKKIPENSIILGGSITSEAKKMFETENLKIIDYLLYENLAILNAIPTAEGAIQIAFENMEITLSGSNSLVIGNGRIGKILSKKLSALGSKTTVLARKSEDFADILSNNIKTTTIEKVQFDRYDVIFNTVPSMILDEKSLLKISDKTLIIDLASKPGGVDFKASQKHNKKVIWALGLPGKVAPKSASKYLYTTIIDILDNLEVK